MNCIRIKDTLSAYHDEELASAERTAVEEHLEGCPACAAELVSFRRLSNMAAELHSPEPPDGWAAIERELASATLASRRTSSWIQRRRLHMALAASLLLAAGLGAAYYAWLRPAVGDQHLAMNFDKFLSHFAEQPLAAEQILLTNYNGRRVNFDEATRLLGYQPVMASGAPPGYVIEAVYLFDMPCCKCPQVICRSDDGLRLAIFEHASDQPIWYGDRPAIDANCGGKRARIVEADMDMLAATWPTQERRVTIVGARDVEEVAQLASYLDGRGRGLQ